ncbi:hypothetical protein DsansV1_C14g0130911 [Dioscorea sansibarensis]
MALPNSEIEKREKANLEKYRGCKSKKLPRFWLRRMLPLMLHGVGAKGSNSS